MNLRKSGNYNKAWSANRKSAMYHICGRSSNYLSSQSSAFAITAIIVYSKIVNLTFVTHQSQRSIHVFNRPMTEGYGDIACQTVLGKLVLACFLSVGLVSYFPPGKQAPKSWGF